MSFSLDPSNFLSNLSTIELKVIAGTRLYAETAAQKLVADAKSNAKWKDITALSRQTISAEVESSGASQRIILKGGTTEHFIYLELSNSGRFAVIKPTMIKMSSDIIKGWNKVISNL